MPPVTVITSLPAEPFITPPTLDVIVSLPAPAVIVCPLPPVTFITSAAVPPLITLLLPPETVIESPKLPPVNVILEPEISTLCFLSLCATIAKLSELNIIFPSAFLVYSKTDVLLLLLVTAYFTPSILIVCVELASNEKLPFNPVILIVLLPVPPLILASIPLILNVSSPASPFKLPPTLEVIVSLPPPAFTV